MSTGLIIAIIVVAALLILGAMALMAMRPRMKRRAAQQRMDERRTRAADRHRSEAEQRQARAQMAEQEARRARAEADLHESRAEMHERGMADDELGDARDSRFERDRELLADDDGGTRAGTDRDGRRLDDRDTAAAEETRTQTTSTRRESF